MARLTAEPVFGALLAGCRGVDVSARAGLGIATVLAVGHDLDGWPIGPVRAETEGVTVLGISRRTWLAVGDGGPGTAALLSQRMAGKAHVADQSGAYGLIDLSGPHADAVLAKGLNIDLDPSAFPADGVAVTTIAHIGVVLWRRTVGGGYHLATPRSSAVSFMHWLSASAAEFA
jgi:sarcosine oxidase subunit gamma